VRQVAISFITALLIAAVALAIPARAQPAVEDFYKGKQINLIVGYGPGGGYDVVARLLARHLGRYVAGNPNIVMARSIRLTPGLGRLYCNDVG
jgi:tripartite-type tricarboxylate transporter receptor subunit TctC